MPSSPLLDPNYKVPHVEFLQGLAATAARPAVIDAISQVTLERQVPRMALNQDESMVESIHESGNFFVLDLERVAKKYLQWTKAFPNVHAHYAVKSNPQPEITQLLQGMGSNFDCASVAEMHLVLSAGATPDQIIYANPVKLPAHLRQARELQVERVTADNPDELRKIAEIYPTAKVLLRIWVNDEGARCVFSHKYGATLPEASEMLRVAKDLGLHVYGVSFHVGSGGSADAAEDGIDVSYHNRFASAIKDAEKLFREGLAMGHKMRQLDLGGGFPGTDTPAASLESIAAVVNPLLQDPASVWQEHDVSVIAEPGRYMCSESQTLVTRIIGKRVRGGMPSYVVAEGLYQSFGCIMWDHAKLIPSQGSDLVPSIVFGQTCDGLDCISKDLPLPAMNVGDWLSFNNMGAYTNGSSSAFNGFPAQLKTVCLPPSAEFCNQLG